MEENLSFEQAIKRLEAVVRELETGDLPLDQALALFQEGVLLTRRCGGLLDAAEARIEKLLEQNGEAVTVPFEPEKA
ncbi:MAG: exodeoxyribonuclease VII small subunit [Bacillota bacterium]